MKLFLSLYRQHLSVFRVESTHSAWTLRSIRGILPFSQKIFHPPLCLTPHSKPYTQFLLSACYVLILT